MFVKIGDLASTISSEKKIPLQGLWRVILMINGREKVWQNEIFWEVPFNSFAVE